MIHIVEYINNCILSISTDHDTSETFTLSGSRDMAATGVSTISSFITVFCKFVLTQLINSIHVGMFHLAVVYQ